MAKVYGVGNLDTRLSASMEDYIQTKPVNNIFNTNPTLRYLLANKTIKEGESLNVPVTYVQPTNVAPITAYGVVDVTPQDTDTTANYRWRMYPSPIRVSDKELAENTGKKVFDLVTHKTDVQMRELRDTLNGDFWATTQSGERTETFVTMTDTTTSIGGISAAAYWQGVSTTGGSFASQGTDDWETTILQIANEGSEMPTVGLTTRTVYEFYLKHGRAKVEIPATQKLSLGFKVAEFMGVDIIWDSDVTSGVTQFVNTEFTKLCLHRMHNFKVGKFIRPHNGLNQTAIISVMLNLATTKRGSLGRVTAQVA